jgi:RHS repeat-associated protein
LSAAVSGQNGTFAIPGVPVTGGANALSVTVTDVSGNVATQVVNVTVVNGTTDIGYDGNGNQTNHNGWAMTYDRENRLASASSAALAVSYSYDALGRLIQRVAGNSTNRLYYAGWQLIAEYDGTGALQRKYVYGPGIDEPIRVTANGTNYYYHQDGLGSVTEITDSTGNLVEQYRYDVYGAATFYNATGVATNSSAIGNRLLFTGRDRDPDTGWYNYRNRYFNSTLGRFAQPDPIRYRGGLNLYRYVENNPVNISDPSGLDSTTIGPITIYWGNPPGTPQAVIDAEKAHEAKHRADFWNGNIFTMPAWQLEQRGFAAEIPCLKNALKNPSLSAGDRQQIESALNIAQAISTDESAARNYANQPLPTNLEVSVPSGSYGVQNRPNIFIPNVIDPWNGGYRGGR